MAAKIVYGKSKETGELVHISTVERGLSCNCVCPACGEDLVARKGTKMRHHFAHRGDVDGEGSKCTTAGETVVHYLAKEAFKKLKTITVPIDMLKEEKDGYNIKFNYTLGVPYSMSMECEIQEVLIEKEIDGMNLRPDVTLVTDKGTIYIEIYVTHKVSDENIRKYRSLYNFAFEIDLSSLSDYEYVDEEWMSEIINKSVLSVRGNVIKNPIKGKLISVLRKYINRGYNGCIFFPCSEHVGLGGKAFGYCKNCRNNLGYREIQRIKKSPDESPKTDYVVYCLKSHKLGNTSIESLKSDLDWVLEPTGIKAEVKMDGKLDNTKGYYNSWRNQ